MPGSVGSGSTDQQLMAAEQELSQVGVGGGGREGEGKRRGVMPGSVGGKGEA